MKVCAYSALTSAQALALVRACRDVDGGPWPGVRYGNTPALPTQPTESQMAANDRASTLGWTFHGPQGHQQMAVAAGLCDRIDGDEGTEKVRKTPANTLGLARAAIAIMEHRPMAVVAAETEKSQ